MFPHIIFARVCMCTICVFRTNLDAKLSWLSFDLDALFPPTHNNPWRSSINPVNFMTFLRYWHIYFAICSLLFLLKTRNSNNCMYCLNLLFEWYSKQLNEALEILPWIALKLLQHFFIYFFFLRSNEFLFANA